VEILQNALKAAANDPKLQASLSKVGSAVYYADDKEYGRIIRNESAFIKQMVDSGKLKPE
jgi:hypothetical protein